MSVATFHFASQYLRCNTEVTVILPSRPMHVDAESFFTSGKRYKVLWLLHGGMGDHTDWLRRSCIEMYAEENELIAVMPSAYNSSYANWVNFANGLHMTDYFFKELMPFVYNWLPASSKREDNFIAGMSMGGQGTLKYTLLHPECFAGSIMLSSRAEEFPEYYEMQLAKKPNSVTENLVKNHGGIENFMASADNIRDRMRDVVRENRLDAIPPVYHSIGTRDSHFDEYLQFKEFCQEIGFTKISFHEVEGYAHEWRLWDREIQAGLRYFGFDCPQR